jgi:hypothetical protein
MYNGSDTFDLELSNLQDRLMKCILDILQMNTYVSFSCTPHQQPTLSNVSMRTLCITVLCYCASVVGHSGPCDVTR